MDLSKISAQVKGFQRRTTQKVLQQMGIADKTEDESPAYQNFLALGSFTSQLKTTIQASDTCFEKTCTAQTHLAGQIQSYLHSELSGDADLPPGELNEFFNASEATRQHADLLQQVAGKFYGACSELGNNALQAVVGQLNDLVLRPIINDEEFGNITKDILEDKKKATLDYDSYRRAAANNTGSPDYERTDAKLRMAKERYEQTSRRLAEHIDQRNQIRCKLLVHGIVTAIQQYCNYHVHAFNILRDTATSLKPLLEAYQMSEDQLQVAINLDTPYQHSDPSRAKSPPRPGQSSTAAAASSVFDDPNNGRPKAPTAKVAATNNTGRGASPQLDEMMQQNLNLKKPAPPQQKNAAPMNTYGATGKPSPQPAHQGPQRTNSPQPVHHAPPPQQQNQPQMNLFGSTGLSPPTTHSPAPAAPSAADILIDLNVDQPSIIDDPLLQSHGSGFGGAAPMQPSNVDPFASFNTPPIKPTPQAPPPTNTNNGFFNTSSVNDPFGSFTAPPTKPPTTTNNDPFAAFNTPPTQANRGTPPTSANKTPLEDFGNLLFNDTPQPNKSVPPTQTQRPATTGVNPIDRTGGGQTERGELNPAITQRINNWANKGGRQSNLRALLSTLHEVIWTDSGWDALSLADVLTPAQVKKAYIRANKIVHPDKMQTGTVEQQLIAQRLFEALRVSYEAFSDDPK